MEVPNAGFRAEAQNKARLHLVAGDKRVYIDVSIASMIIAFIVQGVLNRCEWFCLSQ